MSEQNTRYNNPHLWIAIGLIAAGIGMILDNMHIIYFDVWDFWPVIFIIIGLSKFNSGNHGEKASGVIFLIVGVAFCLAELDLINWHMIGSFWPLLLILFGVSILLRHRDSDGQGHDFSQDRISAMSVFGGNERMVTSQNFEGGTVTTVFGSTVLDFSAASLAPGDNVIDIVTLFGGVELKVPASWNFAIKVLPIFGASEDKRSFVGSADLPSGGVLILKGMVIFGGLEVKDA